MHTTENAKEILSTVQETLDSKTVALFENLINAIQEQSSVITILHNRVLFLENKVNELERYSSKDCLIINNLPLLNGDYTKDVLALFNDVLGVEVTAYDLKAVHPLGVVSKNKPCTVITKFVYFDIKNRIWGRKKFLKNYVNPANKRPVFLNERLTQRDLELKDYAKGLGMYTTTFNSAPQVLVPNANGGYQRHTLVDFKDADDIFQKKKPLLFKQQMTGRNPSMFNMDNKDANLKLQNNKDKRQREQTPRTAETMNIAEKLKQLMDDRDGLVNFIESLQKDSPVPKMMNNKETEGMETN